MSIHTPFEHHYSDSINRSTVAMLGIYPPPYGGVSVHIQRVMDKLSAQHNKLHFFDTEQTLRTEWLPAYLIKLIVFLMRNRPAHIFYHSTYLRSSILDLMAVCSIQWFLKARITIVEHDCRHLYKRSRLFKKWYQWVLQRIDAIVFIGDSTFKSYHDTALILPEHHIEGAFLPPATYNAALASEKYPSSLFVFLRDYTPIIMVNASHLMLVDGKDVYGLDQCIALITALRKEYPDVGLLIVLATVGHENYLQVLYECMRSAQVSEQVYILQNNQELWPLFKHIDIFVRPTLSDGASVSVQEALYFKVPTIASDVCPRPEETKLFKIADGNDFLNATRGILRERVYGNQQQRNNLHAQQAR